MAVFLSKANDPGGHSYTLTAYHVVPYKDKDVKVITLGGSGILSKLLDAHDRADYAEVDFLLERWNEEYGHVVYGGIGVNLNGWRTDSALISLRDEWRGSNRVWFDQEEILGLYNSVEVLSQSTFSSSKGITANADPDAGMLCYKDGASQAALQAVWDPRKH